MGVWIKSHELKKNYYSENTSQANFVRNVDNYDLVVPKYTKDNVQNEGVIIEEAQQYWNVLDTLKTSKDKTAHQTASIMTYTTPSRTFAFIEGSIIKPEYRQTQITVHPVDILPTPEYLVNLKEENKASFLTFYNTTKPKYNSDPIFYLTIAHHLLSTCTPLPTTDTVDNPSTVVDDWKRPQAIQILSNLAEIKLDNPQYLRILAFMLESQGEHMMALSLFEKILKLRPDEPQAYFDLAHTQARLSRYFEALENLNKVVEGHWDTRFSQIEVLALTSMAHITSQIDPLQLAVSNIPSIVNLLLVNPFVVDLRILLSWDTNDVDMELHVEEPNGEMCYSFHNCTSNGGILSRDFTAGYGPEEYMIKKAVPGDYKIYVRLATPRKLPLSSICIRLCVFTHYGLPEQEQEKLIMDQIPTNRYKQLVPICTVHYH